MFVQELYLFSTNPKKLGELREVFGGLRVESLSLVVPELPDVLEDGLTFEANARKKALAGAAASGKPTVADDSGLEVDALGGEPGVWSDRFAIRNGRIPPEADRAERTRANNDLLLEMLGDAGPDRRTARFVCALSCALPSHLFAEKGFSPEGVILDEAGNGWTTVTVRGTCEGRITPNMDGEGGFGYDPLFWSEDLGKTFGSSSPAEKQAVSHRGRAAERMQSFLEGAGLL